VLQARQIDADIKKRIDALKNERDLAAAALDRIDAYNVDASELTTERRSAFAALVRDKLDTGDIHARQDYLRAVIAPNGTVRASARKWRARRDSNSRPSGSKPDALSS
jgi:hypothetical protein